MNEIQELGDGHYIHLVYYRDDQPVGCNVHHLTKEGKPCVGWVAFADTPWSRQFNPDGIQTWDVPSRDPLTLTPSIACRGCGDHGFITNGKWVRA